MRRDAKAGPAAWNASLKIALALVLGGCGGNAEDEDISNASFAAYYADNDEWCKKLGECSPEVNCDRFATAEQVERALAQVSGEQIKTCNSASRTHDACYSGLTCEQFVQHRSLAPCSNDPSEPWCCYDEMTFQTVECPSKPPCGDELPAVQVGCMEIDRAIENVLLNRPGTAEPAESFDCCRIQRMCENCPCDKSLIEIGNNDSPAACEAALESDEIAGGCSAYPGTQAILDCD